MNFQFRTSNQKYGFSGVSRRLRVGCSRALMFSDVRGKSVKFKARRNFGALEPENLKASNPEKSTCFYRNTSFELSSVRIEPEMRFEGRQRNGKKENKRNKTTYTWRRHSLTDLLQSWRVGT